MGSVAGQRRGLQSAEFLWTANNQFARVLRIFVGWNMRSTWRGSVREADIGKDSRKGAKTQSPGVRPLRLRAFAWEPKLARHTGRTVQEAQPVQDAGVWRAGHRAGWPWFRNSNPSFIWVTFLGANATYHQRNKTGATQNRLRPRISHSPG